MTDVLCFGNLQLDVLCRTVTALPPPGGLRMIESVDFVLSGNGGNVAAVLGRLGVSVELAGYSGADPIGEQFRSMLAAEGVGLERLLRHPSMGTGTSVIAVAPNGERSIVFVNGANDAFQLEDVPDTWLQRRRLVAVTSLFVLPQFTGAAAGRLFARARAAGATTLLNICWDAQGQGLPFLAPTLAEADYFVLNYDEGRQLVSATEPERILAALQEHTPGVVVLTLGERGCCLGTTTGIQFIPAVPVQAVDSTGAGDSFVGGLIAGLVRGYAPEAAARLACRVAAYAVTGPGSYGRIPRHIALDRWLNGAEDE